MAGPTKKPRKPSEDDSGDDYNSDESGSYHGPQEIQATFEGRNLEGQDFHGIKQLLQQLFLTAHIDLSQMCDMLIAQHGVGSVLKQSCNDSDDDDDVEMVEESDVFGVTTVLNLSSHKETPCVQQLYKLVEDMTKNSNNDTQQTIKQILQQHKVGFLINERFLNIPSKISAPMLNALQDELNRFKKKDQSYDFDYYLLIAKAWKPKGNPGGELSFANDEEQIFLTQADYSCDYSVSNKGDTGLTGNWNSEDVEVIPYRVVILFKSNKFEGIVDAVKNFVQV